MIHQKKKIKGILTWVNDEAMPLDVNFYESLLNRDNFDPNNDLENQLNTNNHIKYTALGEPSFENVSKDFKQNDPQRYQFERIGYFITNDVYIKDDVQILSFNNISRLRSSI